MFHDACHLVAVASVSVSVDRFSGLSYGSDLRVPRSRIARLGSVGTSDSVHSRIPMVDVPLTLRRKSIRRNPPLVGVDLSSWKSDGTSSGFIVVAWPCPAGYLAQRVKLVVASGVGVLHCHPRAELDVLA